VRLPGDEDPVGALPPDSAHPAFGEGVRPRRLRRRPDNLDARGREHGLEGGGEVLQRPGSAPLVGRDLPAVRSRLLGAGGAGASALGSAADHKQADGEGEDDELKGDADGS
jgi:hypothetical protein